jgi:hypothetical protein
MSSSDVLRLMELLKNLASFASGPDDDDVSSPDPVREQLSEQYLQDMTGNHYTQYHSSDDQQSL